MVCVKNIVRRGFPLAIAARENSLTGKTSNVSSNLTSLFSITFVKRRQRMDKDLIELLRNDSLNRDNSDVEAEEPIKSSPGTLALLASILKVKEK